jgi:2-[hydroxy(phenyl)methyl]-succinyl-CoA dehydrogenase BbsD subunit
MLSFKRKRVLVTGSGSGIGKAIAKAFAKRGAYLIVNDIREDRANSTKEDITREGGNAISITADISSKAQVSGMVQRAVTEYGWIDILVNNAGIMKPSGFFDLDVHDWKRTFEVNVTGTFLCSQTVGLEMINRKFGRIINISSTAAKVPYPYLVDYCCAKAAIIQLTRVLALIFSSWGVTVNAVAPGSTEGTEMWEYVLRRIPKIREFTIKGNPEKFPIGIPLGRLGSLEDQASIAMYLASEEAGFITGQTVFVDGGSSVF